MKSTEPLEKLITTSRVIVCSGSGGVGKTTTSAAIGIAAAQIGKKAVVITIDPAKRLATSLGLKELQSTPTNLTSLIPQSASKKRGGEFWAVMPDTRQTFERFVFSMTGEDSPLSKRLFNTSIFKVFAKEFSGANEYMAMEKLYELYQDSRFDLVVLDTPPSANLRSFLEAPQVLAEFFDDRIIKFLAIPTSGLLSNKLLSAPLKKILDILESLTGTGFIGDLLEFSSLLLQLKTQFTENLSSIQKLLRQESTRFVIVTCPERMDEEESLKFVKQIREQKYFFWGFIVNRMTSLKLGLKLDEDFEKSLSTKRKELEKSFSPDEIKILESNFKFWSNKLEKEKDLKKILSQNHPEHTHAFVAEQAQDVHNIQSLSEISRQLLES